MFFFSSSMRLFLGFRSVQCLLLSALIRVIVMPLLLMYFDMAKVTGQAELDLMGASDGVRATAGGYAIFDGKDRGEDTT